MSRNAAGGAAPEGTAANAEPRIDYKNVDLLTRFTDTGGRIRSRRRTRTSARNQRLITRAIKQARHLALLPYTGDHLRLYGE